MPEHLRTPANAAASTKRRPLAELKNSANTPPIARLSQSAVMKNAKLLAINAPLPHNESLEPDGTLVIRSNDTPDSQTHKRISQLTSEGRDPKRNSATSTISTTASGSRRKTFIGHWQLGKTIGKGGCSRVRIVRHRYRDQYGAVKIITRSVAEKTRAQSLANLIENTRGSPLVTAAGYKPIPYGLEREIAVMKLLEHPNIVRLYDVWENRNELYLIMEYIDGGELFHFVDERKGLREDEAVYIFRQIVSALLYCHRLRICHRDLKPENILLDRSDLTVKLIDFGMAALQPEGKLLSTPCGSPHYAAPEVVSSKPYDGTQADVWSCGVILYVMLTGTTPYNYGDNGDIRILFRDISRAKYFLPPDLGIEAKDLIRRIFVPDPRNRLTMDEVWDHPLLHKFDDEFSYQGANGSKEAAIGPLPHLNQWKVKRIQDIDREILSNMRTLWHSESENHLMEQLLNDEHNQEKLFYAALIKHREENLENYVGDGEEISYSASDYHHSRTQPNAAATRSQSQYSILNDEHLRLSSSFAGATPSVSSYDPYRASKDPLMDERGDYLNVIVHRNGTTSTRHPSTAGRRLRHPHSTRIEQLKQAKGHYSNVSISSLQQSHRSRPSMPRSSSSRHSVNKSLLPSSPPVIATMRPSDVHKRGVSFTHIRRVSTASAHTSEHSTKSSLPLTPCLHKELRGRYSTPRSKSRSAESSSPKVARQQNIVRSRKERHLRLEKPSIHMCKAEATPGQHMRRDIRKHSAELEKACEEAFFRDSFGSGLTAPTSLAEKPSPSDIPSSLSIATSATPEHAIAKAASRPLPDLPKDTPNTYLVRTLEDTRKKLEAYKTKGEDSTAKFEEVMKMLESIMPTHDERRIRTAPEAGKACEPIGFLPMISEESSEIRSSRDGRNWQRSTTDPVARTRNAPKETIRVVESSSPANSAPIRLQKHDGSTKRGKENSQRLLDDKDRALFVGGRHSAMHANPPPLVDEDVPFSKPRVIPRKRSGWFHRRKKDGEPDHRRDLTLKAFGETAQRKTTRSVTTREAPDTSSAKAHRSFHKPRVDGAKKGWPKWIGRMAKERSAHVAQGDGDTTLFDNNSLGSLASSQSTTDSSNEAPPAAGNERSWFARFFKIKPAIQILCFCIPRGRARQELVILFKEWQRHGIVDLEYSRESNTIVARVDKQNSLNMRPVAFRIELFIVLEQGRRAGISIARFVQLKGAASGFRKVVEITDSIMRGRGWLMEDEEKWRALCEVIGES